jgi:hypothetical protein
MCIRDLETAMDSAVLYLHASCRTVTVTVTVTDTEYLFWTQNIYFSNVFLRKMNKSSQIPCAWVLQAVFCESDRVDKYRDIFQRDIIIT